MNHTANVPQDASVQHNAIREGLNLNGGIVTLSRYVQYFSEFTQNSLYRPSLDRDDIQNSLVAVYHSAQAILCDKAADFYRENNFNYEMQIVVTPDSRLTFASFEPLTKVQTLNAIERLIEFAVVNQRQMFPIIVDRGVGEAFLKHAASQGLPGSKDFTDPKSIFSSDIPMEEYQKLLYGRREPFPLTTFTRDTEKAEIVLEEMLRAPFDEKFLAKYEFVKNYQEENAIGFLHSENALTLIDSLLIQHQRYPYPSATVQQSVEQQLVSLQEQLHRSKQER